MRTVYIDKNCFAYANEREGLTPIEVDMFDGFSNEFIEGFMIVPDGCTAQHPDGRTLVGFTVAQWKDSKELDNAQREYERQMLKEYESELAEMDAALLEVQYQNLTEGL